MIISNKIKEIKKILPDMSEKETEKHAISATHAEKQRIERKKVSYLNEIYNLKRIIEESKRENVRAFNQRNRFFTMLEYLEQSEQEKYNIIHKYIKSVSVTNCTEMKATKKLK